VSPLLDTPELLRGARLMLLEACLRARDYPRAREVLADLATIPMLGRATARSSTSGAPASSSSPAPCHRPDQRRSPGNSGCFAATSATGPLTSAHSSTAAIPGASTSTAVRCTGK
jgi:hypothetical protein